MFTSKHATKCFLILMALALSAIFLACGDSSTGKDDVEKVSVVDSISKLPDCDEDYEGEQVFVIAEEAMRICAGGKWYALKDSSESSDPKKDLKDSLAKDSVSKDSTKTDSTEVDKPDVPKDSVELDSEKVATSLDSLVGYSQKGPFTTGSDVYLYELESGRTLKQTNGNFTSNIVNNKGRYHFAARDLVSQYAMIVVDGNYRNEVTGKVSDNKIRLKAITDLSKRTSANVNLLSHLEYDRVYYLVTKEKMKVYAAKKQAQQEILAQFHIDSKNFRESEDLDVFGKTDADAALLAVSILLQGDRSEADLTALLTMISTDLADSGRWKNDSIKTYIADWIFEKDSLDLLKQFRANVKGWGLSDTVPNFEKYVRNYWYYNYGLKECSTKGKVVKNSNKKSSRKDYYFICKNNGWEVAKDIEQDIYQWADGQDGETKPGSVNKNNIYVFDKDQWRPANEEEVVLGGCIEGKAGNVSIAHDEYYICRDREWTVASDFEKDTYQWVAGADGETKNGNVNTSGTYVYDSDHWRRANDLEAAFGGCVETGKVDHIESNYYICRDREWVTASDIEKDTYQWVAGADGETKKGNVNTSWTYVYDSDHWRRANDLESAFGGCVETGKVDHIESNYYICRDREWVAASDLEKDTYQWVAGADGEIKTGNVTSQVYVYDSDHWRAANSIEAKLGGCVEAGKVDHIGNDYYICRNREWVTASDIEKDTYGWGTNYTAGKVKSGNVNTTYYYVFESGKWRLGNAMDNLMQNAGGTGCISEGSRSVRYTDKYYYICTKKTSGNIPHVWEKTSEFYSDTAGYQSKCNASGPYSKGQILKGYVSNKEYVCDNGTFRTLQNNESRFRQGCVSYINNNYFTVDSTNGYKSVYKCDNNNKNWVFDITKNKGSIKDSRDKNRTYGTITIGKQVWMSEDMMYGTMAINGSTPSYWAYPMLDSYTTFYAKSVLGDVCPNGWHVSTSSEWNTLFDYVGGAVSLLANSDNNGWSGMANPYGFSAHKNGMQEWGGSFHYLDKASYWLSGEDSVVQMDNYGGTSSSNFSGWRTAVRCVKN